MHLIWGKYRSDFYHSMYCSFLRCQNKKINHLFSHCLTRSHFHHCVVSWFVGEFEMFKFLVGKMNCSFFQLGDWTQWRWVWCRSQIQNSTSQWQVLFVMFVTSGYDDISDCIDLIICLGGDGTLLYASSLFQVLILWSNEMDARYYLHVLL